MYSGGSNHCCYYYHCHRCSKSLLFALILTALLGFLGQIYSASSENRPEEKSSLTPRTPFSSALFLFVCFFVFVVWFCFLVVRLSRWKNDDIYILCKLLTSSRTSHTAHPLAVLSSTVLGSVGLLLYHIFPDMFSFHSRVP